MSSDLKVERPRELRLPSGTKQKVSFSDSVESTSGCRSLITQSTRKMRLQTDTSGKNKRKRTYSAGSNIWEKRKRYKLPNKFLLGGNFSDPLNLEALSESEDEPSVDKQVSSKTNGGGAIVKVIIPRNINDPLNLDASSDVDDDLANARQRRRRKNRPNRRRRNSEPTTVHTDSEDENPLSTSLDEKQTSDNSVICDPVSRKLVTMRQVSCPVLPADRASEASSSQTLKPPCLKRQKIKQDDKIVSPVVPQRYVDRKKALKVAPGTLPQENVKAPASYNPRNAVYQYGNYNQYYGYRNPDHAIDPRLKFFSREWIEGQDVLDIGCNIGHISLSLARDFEPRKVVGIDIDKKLVNIARKNIRHYYDQTTPDEAAYPKSMRQLYGPIDRPVDESGSRSFPYNVKFYQSNYVLEADELLETVKEEFDTIVCLSVTKWIHLNFGDDGLKRFFQRIYRNLRAGGMLILEPQAWPSYKKKCKLTPVIYENFKAIRLFPDSFEKYLTKDVGFYTISCRSVNNNFSKGFSRPLYLFRKPSESRRSSPKYIPCDTAVVEKSEENLGSYANSNKTSALTADIANRESAPLSGQCIKTESTVDEVKPIENENSSPDKPSENVESKQKADNHLASVIASESEAVGSDETTESCSQESVVTGQVKLECMNPEPKPEIESIVQDPSGSEEGVTETTKRSSKELTVTGKLDGKDLCPETESCNVSDKSPNVQSASESEKCLTETIEKSSRELVGTDQVKIDCIDSKPSVCTDAEKSPIVQDASKSREILAETVSACAHEEPAKNLEGKVSSPKKFLPKRKFSFDDSEPTKKMKLDKN